MYNKEVGGNTKHYIKQEAADEIYSKVMSVSLEKYRFYYGEFVNANDETTYKYMNSLNMDENISLKGETYIRNITISSSSGNPDTYLGIFISETRTNNVSSGGMNLNIHEIGYESDTESIISEDDTGDKYVITLYYMEV